MQWLDDMSVDMLGKFMSNSLTAKSAGVGCRLFFLLIAIDAPCCKAVLFDQSFLEAGC